jgi:two-component system nitrogen regulation sensor histidine kinase GlnL
MSTPSNSASNSISSTPGTTVQPTGSAAGSAESQLGFMEAILASVPMPILVVGHENRICFANDAAEGFFQLSRTQLARQALDDILPFGSPLFGMLDEVRSANATYREHRLDLSTPRTGRGLVCDLYAAPLPDGNGDIVLLLQPQSLADKFSRQLNHRGAARSVTGMAAVLAHEIKNPLFGIRGAAQLLDGTVPEQDRVFTTLIRDETDRIVKLVDSMEVFSDQRPIEREPVNIHEVFERVKQGAQSGFANHINFVEQYDPSLPSVLGNKDQLVQIFLNLVKNAAEAIGSEANSGEIIISSAFRPGVRLSVAGSREKLQLPLEFTIQDNGHGVNPDLLPYLFDPFVTSKSSGTGLGLALVAKLVGDHGGVIECDSTPGRTKFTVLLPKSTAVRHDGEAAGTVQFKAKAQSAIGDQS